MKGYSRSKQPAGSGMSHSSPRSSNSDSGPSSGGKAGHYRSSQVKAQTPPTAGLAVRQGKQQAGIS